MRNRRFWTLPCLFFMLPAWLGACAAPAQTQPAASPSWPGSTPARYDFAWRLSGQRMLAPLQVFDDGVDTWLQFPPGQPVPAIFAVEHGSERLLGYVQAGPYVRLSGVWSALLFRGGNAQARAEYIGTARALSRGSADESVLAVAPVRAESTTSVAASAVADSPDEPALFTVSASDGTIRQALGRWASRAGWTFDAWHWAVDVDVPLAGDAVFHTDFVQSVRDLLAATELSARPLQPCFYRNRVLRVVPWAQPCDRQSTLVAETA